METCHFELHVFCKNVEGCEIYHFKRQFHKMIKHTQTICGRIRKLLTNCLSVFDHFVALALKGLYLDDSFRRYFPPAEYCS